MADPADLGAGGTQEYPNYADDEGETLSLRCYALDGPSFIHSPLCIVRCIRHKERARPDSIA